MMHHATPRITPPRIASRRSAAPLRTSLRLATLHLTLIALVLLFVLPGAAGEKQTCQLESKGDGWHYRTKIDGRTEKCWYEGRRMKPRDELYWAEAPAIAPADEPTWSLIDRWRGEYQNGGAAPGWQHKE